MRRTHEAHEPRMRRVRRMRRPESRSAARRSEAESPGQGDGRNRAIRRLTSPEASAMLRQPLTGPPSSARQLPVAASLTRET